MNAADDAAGMARRRCTRLHPLNHASEAGDGVTRRRSTRLHPQIHASDDGDGVARRRSPRLHPQTHASEEGAGVAIQRSALLRPQIHASEEASAVIHRSRHRRRRRGSSPAALASPLEDDDLLRDILLRLPPQPSSLPRASAVCKRWRYAVTDPRFHRRFCQHHRKPPLLGFFVEGVDGLVFKPAMGPPDRIPPQRFDLQHHAIEIGSCLGVEVLGCRHGRLLIIRSLQKELIVIAPMTGEEHRVQVPPEFKSGCYVNGAVLCAAADHNHVHGSCHSSPFKVVLLSMGRYLIGPQLALARVYYSETGIWGDLISIPTPCHLHDAGTHGSLVGNALYWLCRGGDYILKFDLDGQSLAVIRAPPITNDVCYRSGSHQIIQAVDGAVGLAILSHNGHTIQMWQKEINSQSVNKWLLWETIEMHNIHGLPAQIERKKAKLIFILGYAEDTDGILLYMDDSVYMVQLKLMQSRKLCETPKKNHYHSFESFYMSGTAIARGYDGAEMLCGR